MGYIASIVARIRASRRGVLGLSVLPAVALAFVIGAVTFGIGLNVLSSVKTGFTAASAEANATNDFILGIGNISAKAPILGLAVVLAIVIGVLAASFSVFGERR